MGGRADSHINDHVDAQTPQAEVCFQTMQDAGGTHQQAITPVSSCPHTSFLLLSNSSFSHSESRLPLTDNFSFYFPRCCLEEDVRVCALESVLNLLPVTQHDRSRNHCQVCCSAMHIEACRWISLSHKCYRVAGTEPLVAVSHSLSGAVLRETTHTETLTQNGVW